MSARIPTAAAFVFCSLMAGAAYAQAPAVSAAPPPPANLAFVDGSVDLVHDGVVERADAPAILLDGDSVRTAYGRAEIVFADGTLLHLDRDGDLEILSPERVRLVAGRAIVRVSPAAARAYFIDTPAASVRLDGRGEYTVSAVNRLGNDLEVSVARGSAEIDDGAQRVVVRGGEAVSLAAIGARAIFRTFNSARWDSFAQWSNERANGFAASRSASQLPVELRAYGPVFDDYGRWDYVAPYGNVCLPSVGAGWRPYYDGSWGHTRYGWTWYGRDRWAWPTHHFGRWGFNGASWFWIPTNVWGPAWVSWGFSAGYVSWAPLGFDGLPAIGFWPRRDHPAYRPYNPWRGWTIVPRNQFGPRRAVRSFAIDGDRVDELSRRALVFGNSGPPLAGGSVRAPGVARTFSTAVPRAPARADRPTYDRTGPIRRPITQPSAGAPADIAVPRNRVELPPRPPQVEYIGGSRRSSGVIGPTDPAVRQDDGRDRRGVQSPEGATERPGRVPRAGAERGDGDARPPAYVPSYRGGYERPAAYDGDRGRGDGRRGDGERGGSIRSAGGDRGQPTQDGSGARERGGERQGAGPAAGAPASGGRGAGGGSRGERGAGGQRSGGGGGAVRRPR